VELVLWDVASCVKCPRTRGSEVVIALGSAHCGLTVCLSKGGLAELVVEQRGAFDSLKVGGSKLSLHARILLAFEVGHRCSNSEGIADLPTIPPTNPAFLEGSPILFSGKLEHVLFQDEQALMFLSCASLFLDLFESFNVVPEHFDCLILI